MEVKNRLKEIRMKEYMLNQREFSKILEVNYRQYNRHENGVTPNLSTALWIAEKLDRKVEDIFYLD